MIQLRHLRILAPLALAAVVSACGPTAPVEPPFYRNLGSGDAQIDAESALTMINRYRANKGEGELVLDPVLQRVAQDQAREMAAEGRTDVSLKRGNAARARLDRAGYRPGPAVENVSAGYWTLAEAFSGWRSSPGHDRTMLDGRMTRMGIATAYRSGSKYKVFWSLVLAAPQDSAVEAADTSALPPAPAAKP